MTSPYEEDGEENVRNLIKREESVPSPDLKHKSKYADKVRHDWGAVKQAHQTMGYAQVPLNPPDQFLKKHTRPLLRPKVDHHCLGRHSPRRTFPGLLDKQEQRNKENQQAEQAKCNFVAANVAQVGKVLPRETKRRVVQDSARGHRDVCMMPNYVWGKNFGKTPKYIIRRKQEVVRFLEAQQNAEPEEESLPFYPISQQERLEILQGLKNYWAVLQQEFQSLPLKIDTEPLKKRKSNLETKLKSLEKDIDLMERHESIYVMPDGESF